jgi:hypothetical protein
LFGFLSLIVDIESTFTIAHQPVLMCRRRDLVQDFERQVSLLEDQVCHMSLLPSLLIRLDS